MKHFFFLLQNHILKCLALNSTLFFIMKILNKRKFQQIALNHSSGIYFKYFIKI